MDVGTVRDGRNRLRFLAGIAEELAFAEVRGLVVLMARGLGSVRERTALGDP
jgi:hypothetical protein